MKKASKTKIARVYANALYEAAVEQKSIDRVKADVDKLKALLAQDASLTAYLANPLWSEEDKKDVLQKTAKALQLSAETLSCLDVVTENRRSANLALILDDFVKVYYLKNGVAEVEVETVKSLSAVQDKKLKKVLAKIFAKEVAVNYILNPAILGGLRVKSGSTMFDDSLAVKLNYLENVMKGK